MKKKLLTMGLAAILAAGSLITTVGAYSVFRTDDNENPTEFAGYWVPDNPFVAGDNNYYYCFNTNGVPVWGGEQVFEDAADEWTSLFSGSAVTVSSAGQCQKNLPTDIEKLTCVGHPDGANTVQYVHDDPVGLPYAACLGIAFSEPDGRITEADIYVNVDHPRFGVEYTAMELALHELGHSVGLGHSCNNKAVMCSITDSNNCQFYGNCSGAGPQTDDQNGIRFIYLDSDGDGCTGVEEYNSYGPNPETKGGLRSDTNPWDFADVPVPALAPGSGSTRNGTISLADVGAVTNWVGAVDNAGPNANGYDYDSDWNGNGIEDGREYDVGSTSGPNGTVSLLDVATVLNSVGHSCTTPQRP